MITHNLQQGTPEWDQFRLEHFGASEAAVMLGLSKKATRDELLYMKSTGLAKEFSEWIQKNILDYGHEVEARARPLIEEIIGEDLYPVTCSDGRISASCDGLTMLEDIAFEHKQFNTELFNSVLDGILPEEHIPQCQQIMMVTGANRVIFTVSDGTEEKMATLDVFPDMAWFERIKLGWEQFEKDLKEYKPTAYIPSDEGRAPERLPALFIEVSGSVTASNLSDFKSYAMNVLDGISTTLETDKDFADAEKTAKWCKDVEVRLDAAKQHALSQTASIDELFRAIDSIKDETREKRLTLEKLVKSRKESIRLDLIEKYRAKFSDHISNLQSEITGYVLEVPMPNFGGAMKGLKNLDSLHNALDTLLASAKISADTLAKNMRDKIRWCNEKGVDLKTIPNFLALVSKPIDDFVLHISKALEDQKELEEQRKLRIIQQNKEVILTTIPKVLIKLGDINSMISPISISASGLESLGFLPVSVEKNAKLYAASDFPLICAALINKITAAQNSGAIGDKAA